MALVEGWERGVGGDLLAFVGRVNSELVVVDAHPVIWILGDYGCLDGGVEEVGRREAELVERGFLEGEFWLGGVEDEPDEEGRGEDGEEEGGEGVEDFLVELVDVEAFLRAVLGRACEVERHLLEKDGLVEGGGCCSSVEEGRVVLGVGGEGGFFNNIRKG